MKTIAIRIGLMLLCLIFILPFYGVKCTDNDDPEEPELCGQYYPIVKEWPNDFLQPAVNFLYEEDGYFVYEYSGGTIDDVCTHKHVTGNIEIAVSGDYSSVVLYDAEVVYGVLFTYPVMDWDWGGEYNEYYTLYKGTFEFGMKHIYGEGPGWFLPIVRIHIKELESVQETHNVMLMAINHIKITYNYYEWKDNS